MKASIFLVASSTLLSQTSAHYLFGRLIFENRVSDTWEYVRKISPGMGIIDDPVALLSPNTEPTSIDLRCGRNASTGWSKPKTATVRAGDTVGFAAGEPKLPGGDARMYHPGFASAWLSKAPNGDLDKYTGDGDWFKILSVTGRTEQSIDFSLPENKPLWDEVKGIWGTFNAKSWNFTIPESTPPGSYLLRFEHIFPNDIDSQYYVNCAHVNIVNPDADVGKPGPLVKIPGVYTRGQKDVYFKYYDTTFDIKKFVPPKPAVWSG